MSATPPTISEALSAALLRTRDARVEEWLTAIAGSTPGPDPEDIASRRSAAEAVVEWLARFLTNDPVATPDSSPLRDFAEATRGTGRSAVDRLGGVDVLEGMLLQDLRGIASSRGTAPAAEDLLDGVQRIRAGIARLRNAVVEASVEDVESAHRLQTFVRTLSHELKNPLGAAASGVALLREEEIRHDDARYRKFAELVERNIARALTLIADLRSLLLMERETPADADVPLPEVIESVMIEVQSAAAEKEVRIDIAEASLPHSAVDGPRMTLILMNLVWNAVNYSDPEKEERWVRIGCDHPEGRSRIYVEDNGRGIPPDAQERIFERFFRAHPEVQGGTGLGLTIAAEAAQQIGASVRFESQPGRGTTFYVQLQDRTPGSGSEESAEPIEA